MIRVVVEKSKQQYNDSNANNLEAALKTFKRKVNRDGILQEVRKREYYVKPGVKRRLKHEAVLKARRKKQNKRGY